VEISYERLEILINEISLGGRIVPIKKASGEEVFILITHCVGVDKLFADIEYKKAFEVARFEGFMTVEETTKLLRERGVLLDADDDKIKSIESKIAGQEAILEKTTRVPANRDRIKEIINALKNELLQILSKKESFLEFSAERKAQESKYLYLAWRSAKDPYTRELIWPMRKDYEDEIDLVFRKNVFGEFVKLTSGMDVSTIRRIARSNLWRIRYLTAMKTGVSLFGIDLPEYTVDQLALAYWSHFYQSVYDMPSSDAPSDDVIEDDDALDAFMKAYMDERSREGTRSKEQKKNKGVTSAWDHGETIVTRSNPIYKDVKYSPTIEAMRNKDKNSISVKK
jgi:hypothetical protein